MFIYCNLTYQQLDALRQVAQIEHGEEVTLSMAWLLEMVVCVGGPLAKTQVCIICECTTCQTLETDGLKEQKTALAATSAV